MARRGERAPREPKKVVAAEPEPQELDRIGVRVITRIRRGTTIRTTIDPSPYRCAALVAELADEAVAYARRTSLRNPNPYGNAIRNLAEFVDEYLPTVGNDPGDARIAGTKVDLIEALFQWEGWMRTRYGLRSGEPYRQATCLLTLIGQRAVRDPEVPENLRRRAAGPPTYKRGQGEVLDEFSNAERLALQNAARDDVRALEERLAWGRELLEDGQDPREGGWKPAIVRMRPLRVGLEKTRWTSEGSKVTELRTCRVCGSAGTRWIFPVASPDEFWQFSGVAA
jgi:hypothetical protein